jgi:hypothetical protein
MLASSQMSGLSRHWPPAKALGALLAVLALVSQLALGAMVLPDESSSAKLAALDAVSILCTGTKAPHHDGPAQHRHHPGDPALCPLSVALALPAVVLTASAALPIPSSEIVVRTRERPPGRGPPLETARVGAPRAPPAIG